ncbi:aminoacyl-tRNA hydrolase [Candidatus Riesia pediculischaeffi]|uniref:Peptidyl-tRNA hydrolase n=1 Tax=Candidatus Riesia pediculischaeffi TaxID=428411 RepID=A0A1V0HK44_9ENTR|nr:aminoacyl-tRNA hydrolase [Candidatus Riesia pediculischaeffi]ARC53198.1 hypothetical protein AOQ87_00580 [Candidatus Riesia pediculischaeffi]
MLRLIAGLSNPEKKYIRTRHNVGALFVEFFSKNFGNTLKKNNRFLGKIDILCFGKERIFLFIPFVHMNCNGMAISRLSRFYHIHPKEILIVHDELDIPVGSSKIKIGGGHNGHKGVLDTEENLKSSNFYRLRIGVGRPRKNEKISDFVLGVPNKKDQKLIFNAINRSASYLHLFIQHEIFQFSKIQNHINSIRSI